jgi:hypothetical protein
MAGVHAAAGCDHPMGDALAMDACREVGDDLLTVGDHEHAATAGGGPCNPISNDNTLTESCGGNTEDAAMAGADGVVKEACEERLIFAKGEHQAAGRGVDDRARMADYRAKSNSCYSM